MPTNRVYDKCFSEKINRFGLDYMGEINEMTENGISQVSRL